MTSISRGFIPPSNASSIWCIPKDHLDDMSPASKMSRSAISRQEGRSGELARGDSSGEFVESTRARSTRA
jgi:hypothetical protein